MGFWWYKHNLGASLWYWAHGFCGAHIFSSSLFLEIMRGIIAIPLLEMCHNWLPWFWASCGLVVKRETIGFPYCLALQNLKEQYVEPALIPSAVSYFLSSLAFWCPNLMYKLLNHLRLSSILIGERCTEAQSPLERQGTRRSPLSPFEQEAQLFI